MPPEIHTLELSPDVNTVKSALRWLEAIGRKEGWPGTLIFALTLSVDEALSNVLKFAFTGAGAEPVCSPQQARVSLICSSTPDRVLIEMFDNGVEYDPTATTLSALPESVDDARIGGHGIRLMRHYLSELSYTRVGGRNKLALTVNLVGARRQDAQLPSA